MVSFRVRVRVRDR